MGADQFPLELDLVGADVAIVFLQNIPGNLVQFDGDAVCRLDGRDLDVVALDVVLGGQRPAGPQWLYPRTL